MAREAKRGSPPAFKEHSERDEGQLDKTCGLKYATEFGNPKDLDKNATALADYVKKNQMKY